MRAYPPPPPPLNGQNPGFNAFPGSLAAMAAPSHFLSRYPPQRPRLLLIPHSPPPSDRATAATSSSANDGVAGDRGGHHYRYSHPSAASSRMEGQQAPEQAASGLGGSSAAAVENTSPETSDILSISAYSTSPSLSRPLTLTLPLPLPPMRPTEQMPPARKRKKPSGALRLRNFLCMHPGCDKSFTDSAHLRDHTVVHTGEKRLSCSVCHKRFARLSTLHEHRRVHTGERPYVCAVPECKKRYSSRAALRFHSSTHAVPPLPVPSALQTAVAATNEAATHEHDVYALSFHCEECGKSFRVRELLMAHRKVHAARRAASATAETALPRPPPPAEAVAADSPEVIQESSPGRVAPPAHANRGLEDTIRAQQGQIERLQAEVAWLRRQVPLGGSVEAPASSQWSAEPRGGSTSTTDPLPSTAGARAMTAPVELLRDGFKPFQCCICHHRFANFYQLTFHGKQHPTASAAEVTGGQTSLPVGPKYCPEATCEYAEATGKSLRNLQTLKRHWQRRHQTDRPYTCSHCPVTHQKTFKTRENLKAHEKDCRRNLAVR
ncbi:hypothetical protein BBJ28_00008102 [Nothophytophthora sp. Chile5]|nr:hypothetical protein BBJ28_00008102 [Nothophytophthora sp. Chile5]